MKNELICIICPNSCVITRNASGNLSGHLCKRGLDFALQEFNDPKRSITSTVRTKFTDIPVVSVRTDKEISKDLIFALMEELKKVIVKERLGIGDIVIKNVLYTDVNIIITTNLLKE